MNVRISKSNIVPLDIYFVRITAEKIKSSPIDIDNFRTETSVKYPTFSPTPQLPPSLLHAPIAQLNSSRLTTRLAKAYSPIPVRHHYHHDDNEASQGGQPQSIHPQLQPQANQNTYRQATQPATPAPSPPPLSLNKPKKQQYQTDQSRPFLFPFSRTQAGKEARLVPFAIDEADRLYNKHMYVGLALSQMWRTREDCMTAESGLDHIPGTEGEFRSSTFNEDVSTL